MGLFKSTREPRRRLFMFLLRFFRVKLFFFPCETERTAERSRRSREREGSAVSVEGGRRHHLEPVPAALQKPHQVDRRHQHCRPLSDVSAGSDRLAWCRVTAILIVGETTAE